MIFLQLASDLKASWQVQPICRRIDPASTSPRGKRADLFQRLERALILNSPLRENGSFRTCRTGRLIGLGIRRLRRYMNRVRVLPSEICLRVFVLGASRLAVRKQVTRDNLGWDQIEALNLGWIFPPNFRHLAARQSNILNDFLQSTSDDSTEPRL